MAGILIVDDAGFMREMLKDILIQNGYEVSGEAVNGWDAVKKYQAIKPDAVTMDITMPELNGLEAVKKIKEFDNNAKIIMCSALGQKVMVVDAIQAGAIDFIVKPFKPEKVIEVLKRVLA